MKLKKQGDWIHYATENSKPFYYNESTGDFQWIDPTEPIVEVDNEGLETSRSNFETEIRKIDLSDKESDEHVSVHSSPRSASSLRNSPLTENASLGDWKPYMDPTSGFVFWFNQVTQLSQWECPAEIREQAIALNYSPSSLRTPDPVRLNSFSRKSTPSSSFKDLLLVKNNDDLGI